jgi:Thiol-activated cytolysin
MNSLKLFVIFGVIILMIGCQRSKINKIIGDMQTFPAQLDASIETNSPATNEMRDGVRYSCYTKSGEEKKSLEEFITFNPSNGILYPGSLVHGETLESGLLTNVNIKRGSGTLTLNNVILTDTTKRYNMEAQYALTRKTNSIFASYKIMDTKHFFKVDTFKYSRHVKEVNEQNIKQATTELLNNIPATSQAARIFFTKTEVTSIEKDFLKAGVSVEWMKNKFSAEVSRLKSSTMSKYMVKVVQPYYDISFKPDFKNTLEAIDFFNSSVSAKDIEDYYENYKRGSTKPNPPTYIQTITYGRMLILVAESNEKQDILNKTMDLTFQAGLVSGTSHLQQEQLNILRNSSFTVFSVGGSGEATIKILTAGKEGIGDSLSSYLKSGAEYSRSSPAFPISYVSRYIKNDNVAKLGLAFKFSVPICIPNPRQVTNIRVVFFVTEDDKDDDESVRMTVIKNGNTRITETPPYGYGQTWPDNSGPIPINVPVNNLNEAELASTQVWIFKSPEHGGGSGYGGGMKYNLQLIAVLDDGTELAWRYYSGISMGDGDNNYQAF